MWTQQLTLRTEKVLKASIRSFAVPLVEQEGCEKKVDVCWGRGGLHRRRRTQHATERNERPSCFLPGGIHEGEGKRSSPLGDYVALTEGCFESSACKKEKWK